MPFETNCMVTCTWLSAQDFAKHPYYRQLQPTDACMVCYSETQGILPVVIYLSSYIYKPMVETLSLCLRYSSSVQIGPSPNHSSAHNFHDKDCQSARHLKKCLEAIVEENRHPRLSSSLILNHLQRLLFDSAEELWCSQLVKYS